MMLMVAIQVRSAGEHPSTNLTISDWCKREAGAIIVSFIYLSQRKDEDEQDEQEEDKIIIFIIVATQEQNKRRGNWKTCHFLHWK